MTETKTYRLRVLTKDSNKTDSIVESLVSNDFAIISIEDVSVGTLYEIASSSKKIILLKKKLKIHKIKFTLRKH